MKTFYYCFKKIEGQLLKIIFFIRKVKKKIIIPSAVNQKILKRMKNVYHTSTSSPSLSSVWGSSVDVVVVDVVAILNFCLVPLRASETAVASKKPKREKILLKIWKTVKKEPIETLKKTEVKHNLKKAHNWDAST